MLEKKEIFEKLMAAMGHKDPNIYSRFTNFTEQMGAFVTQQADVCFPEKGLAVFMAALSLAVINAEMKAAILKTMAAPLMEKLSDKINALSPEKLKEVVGRDMTTEELKSLKEFVTFLKDGGNADEADLMAKR